MNKEFETLLIDLAAGKELPEEARVALDQYLADKPELAADLKSLKTTGELLEVLKEAGYTEEVRQRISAKMARAGVAMDSPAPEPALWQLTLPISG